MFLQFFPRFLCLCELGVTYSLKPFVLEIQDTIQSNKKGTLQ